MEIKQAEKVRVGDEIILKAKQNAFRNEKEITKCKRKEETD
jgi:hypothetical protein